MLLAIVQRCSYLFRESNENLIWKREVAIVADSVGTNGFVTWTSARMYVFESVLLPCPARLYPKVVKLAGVDRKVLLQNQAKILNFWKVWSLQLLHQRVLPLLQLR